MGIKKSVKYILILAAASAGIFGIVRGIKAYPEVFAVEISLEKNSGILPDEPAVINFSTAVWAENYQEKGISIFPEDAAIFSWQDKGKRLVIAPKKFWRPETDYKIILPAGRSVLLSNIEKKELSFATEKYPQVIDFFPQNGARDVLLDIEDPIKIKFAASTENFFIKTELSPAEKIAYQSNEEKTEVNFIPENKLKEGELYQVKVFAKYIKDKEDNFKEIYSSSFETLPPPPEKWDKDFSARLAQAKRYGRAKITGGKYIDINLESQILSIFENGKLADAFLVSSGKKGMDTPKGEYKIKNKAPRVWSKQYGLYMPYWMAVAADGKFGIHELPEWPGGYKEGANHLGIPVSHGCIRLGVGPAKTVYDWTEVGTTVIIY